MLFPSDAHHHHSSEPPPQHPQPTLTTSDTPHSDSGRSFSSSSSSEIMGTPFDLGAQRFEYPFPPAQGSPTDPFLPLSSSITSHSHSHTQMPPWPIHLSKSFPLTPPPLGKLKAHPKLRSANAREPPVPPGLVKRRSRIAGINHQSSSEEPSDRSDAGDEIARARHPRVLLSLTEVVPRKPPPSDDASSSRSDFVPVKQAVSLPIGPFDRPPVQNPAEQVTPGAGSTEGNPRATVLQREMNPIRPRELVHSFMLYCWILASQLLRWLFRFLGWFSRT